jgi:hypothetical protein
MWIESNVVAAQRMIDMISLNEVYTPPRNTDLDMSVDLKSLLLETGNGVKAFHYHIGYNQHLLHERTILNNGSLPRSYDDDWKECQTKLFPQSPTISCLARRIQEPAEVFCPSRSSNR